MRRRDTIGLIGAALGLAGCWSDTYTWNQKLTVTVDTPDGQKSGSAVTQVTWHVGDGGLNGHIRRSEVKGEATIVDLGNGKYLFALLSRGGEWQPTEYWAEMTFDAQLPDHNPVDPSPLSEPDRLRAMYDALTKLRAAAVVPKASYPMLVTFGDVNDPKTVKQVAPENLSEVLGAGFALKSITLEVTDEEETEGVVQKTMPWIGNPNTMENPGWQKVPVFARRAIGGLLTDFVGAQRKFMEDKK